jgi:primosomal protein N' (replication factor Y)
MDSDTMRRREDYEEVLAAFGRGDLDVLVGTQMIAKGLDFPGVTAVGIVSADIALHLPDFRAAERTFQLVSQVAGRAGRGPRGGRIVVQTLYPEHPAIRCAAAHDYEGFAAAEDALRRELGYPPYGRLLRTVFEDKDEACAASAARRAAESLRADARGTGVVLGPAPAPIALLRGRHRMHVLVKTAVEDREGFARARDLLIELASHSARPQVAIDVDPVSML